MVILSLDCRILTNNIFLADGGVAVEGAADGSVAVGDAAAGGARNEGKPMIHIVDKSRKHCYK